MLLRCYPTFYEFFQESFGWNICAFKIFHSFGFFVALAFLVAVILLRIELKRRENLGLIIPKQVRLLAVKAPSITDMILPFFMGFVLGLKLPALLTNDAVMCEDPQHFLLSMQGNIPLAIIGGIAIVAYEYWNGKRKAKSGPQEDKIIPYFPSQQVGNILLIAVIAGVFGAKLFYFFEKPSEIGSFMRSPFSDFFSGLTIYGGLICAALSILIFAKVKKIPLAHLYDAMAPAFFLAYAIGRLGCQTAGDGDWGIVNHLPKPGFIPQFLWADVYANNILQTCDPYLGADPSFVKCNWEQMHQLAEPVFPTPLYETILVSILSGIMWMLRKKLTAIPGMLVALFFVFDGVERYLIEKIRVNPREFLGNNFTQAELIAMLFIIFGLSLMGYLYWQHKKKPPVQTATV
jgi:phosphatidylglycerol---prolipoprotein diacylglyceryl transferase